jgi:hypothetical protein
MTARRGSSLTKDVVISDQRVQNVSSCEPIKDTNLLPALNLFGKIMGCLGDILKNVCVFALSLFLMAGIPALASTMCPSDSTTGVYGGGSITPSAETGPCSTSLTLAIPSNGDEALIRFLAGIPGFPPALTFGNFGGLDASVSNASGDQPFIFLVFTDNILAQNPGDTLLFDEFQPSNVVGGDSMPVDPGATLFNLLDDTTGNYVGGQQNAYTLDQWMVIDPSLVADSIAKIDFVIGASGGCNDPSGCPVSLTVNSVAISETPEPGTIVSVATGLLCLGTGLAFRRRKLVQAV